MKNTSGIIAMPIDERRKRELELEEETKWLIETFQKIHIAGKLIGEPNLGCTTMIAINNVISACYGLAEKESKWR